MVNLPDVIAHATLDDRKGQGGPYAKALAELALLVGDYLSILDDHRSRAATLEDLEVAESKLRRAIYAPECTCAEPQPETYPNADDDRTKR